MFSHYSLIVRNSLSSTGTFLDLSYLQPGKRQITLATCNTKQPSSSFFFYTMNLALIYFVILSSMYSFKILLFWNDVLANSSKLCHLKLFELMTFVKVVPP